MRYLMVFSYDGSKYYGYQKQPNKNSVQAEIERVLTIINSNNKVKINASGRTDSGVHALNQKAHFDLIKQISCEKLRNSVNKMLPSSIYIKEIKETEEDFHARFNVFKKEYTYKINVGEYSPIDCNYIYQYNKPLDIKKMQEASTYMIGEHDFTSFTKGNEEKESFVRNIYSINIENINDIISITFCGSGFLRYMVRNMVGSLIEVGNGLRKPKDIQKILRAKDRTKAGITAPACGLYLSNVFYKN